LPEDAGTAADGDHSIPYDSPSARGRDSVAGPVAPTGQGGLLSGTGAGATPVVSGCLVTMYSADINACGHMKVKTWIGCNLSGV
jgi:hypothetical protein